MNTPIQCDIAIIGAGAGGLSLAAGTSQLGLKVVLIEHGLMGGDCLNYGCIPSKSLLAVAKDHWKAQHNILYKATSHAKKIDFSKVMHYVQEVIATIAVNDSIARFEALGVQIIKDSAEFIDKTTLKAGTNIIKARYFVIATGSSAAIPPISGLSEINYYTNETIFSLNQLPQHLLIIGGGPIGCELAQAFAMLGSKVTLLEGLSILSQDDPEAVDIVRQSLINTDVSLLEHIKITQIKYSKNGNIIIEGEQNDLKRSFEGTHLLIATGRKPNIAGLNCELAGIQLHSKGILVNKRLRTSNKAIYAIGDVTGTLQFTHIANAHAGVVLKNIAFKLPAKFQDPAIPYVTYTEPELAQVGKSESFCKTMGIEHSVIKLNYDSNDRAQTDQQIQGFIKVITTSKGTILGATIVGHQAGELLLPWTIAIREGKTLRSFTDAIVAYPTLSELSKRIAGQFYSPKLFSSKVKKLIKFLSYF